MTEEEVDQINKLLRAKKTIEQEFLGKTQYGYFNVPSFINFLCEGDIKELTEELNKTKSYYTELLKKEYEAAFEKHIEIINDQLRELGLEIKEPEEETSCEPKKT